MCVYNRPLAPYNRSCQSTMAYMALKAHTKDFFCQKEKYRCCYTFLIYIIPERRLVPKTEWQITCFLSVLLPSPSVKVATRPCPKTGLIACRKSQRSSRDNLVSGLDKAHYTSGPESSLLPPQDELPLVRQGFGQQLLTKGRWLQLGQGEVTR